MCSQCQDQLEKEETQGLFRDLLKNALRNKVVVLEVVVVSKDLVAATGDVMQVAEIRNSGTKEINSIATTEETIGK